MGIGQWSIGIQVGKGEKGTRVKLRGERESLSYAEGKRKHSVETYA